MSDTVDLSRAVWVKSSYSGGNEGQCVEFAPGTTVSAGVVPVRDSKDPIGMALLFTPDAWASFTSAVQRGEFPSD